MADKMLHAIVNRLAAGHSLERSQWRYLLTLRDDDDKEFLRRSAADIAVSHFGKGIYVRALVEISSYCRNNCNYCGIRCSNKSASRYRLTKEQILNCCKEGDMMGFNTFVLQGGEDPIQDNEWIADVVKSIHAEFPDKAITLSVGERGYDAYRTFREAGACRYLMRHETRDEAHYARLHPANMNASSRRNALLQLKELGYQVGSGMMIGSPYQTIDNLIDDFMFLDELQPHMIGIGPFIPAQNTPFEYFKSGSVELTILSVSLLRIRFPNALIPATTALATLHPQGRLMAILAGANVVMPNLSPMDVREKYSIYDNKKSNGNESAQQLKGLENELAGIGYYVDYSRGDYVENKK